MPTTARAIGRAASDLGRRMQHGVRYPGLPRCRRWLEARAAHELPGFHGRCLQPPALLGAQLPISGAGCSTESGIPDYRDAGGGWKRAQPMNYQDFMADAYNRQRYWARSFRSRAPDAARSPVSRTTAMPAVAGSARSP